MLLRNLLDQYAIPWYTSTMQRRCTDNLMNHRLSHRLDAIITQLDANPPAWRAFALRIYKRWLERGIPV